MTKSLQFGAGQSAYNSVDGLEHATPGDRSDPIQDSTLHVFLSAVRDRVPGVSNPCRRNGMLVSGTLASRLEAFRRGFFPARMPPVREVPQLESQRRRVYAVAQSAPHAAAQFANSRCRAKPDRNDGTLAAL